MEVGSGVFSGVALLPLGMDTDGGFLPRDFGCADACYRSPSAQPVRKFGCSLYNQVDRWVNDEILPRLNTFMIFIYRIS